MELEPNRPVYDWPLQSGELGNEVWFLFLTSPDGATSFWYHVELCSTGETHEGWAWAAVMDREVGEVAFVTSPDRHRIGGTVGQSIFTRCRRAPVDLADADGTD